MPRRRWKPYHYHIVASADRTGKHIRSVYDVRGNAFQLKTPVVAIQTVTGHGFTITLPEKDSEWCGAIHAMRKHIGSTFGVEETDFDSTLFIHTKRHSLSPNDRAILTLSVVLDPKIEFHMIESFTV